MRRIFLFTALSTLLATTLPAEEECSKVARMSRLLPHLIVPLSIDPAIPDDFVVGSPSDEPDLYGGIIWGKEDEIVELIKDPQHIKGTFIRVKLSANVAQDGKSHFTGEHNLRRTLQSMGFHDIHIKHLNWGEYPVLSAQATDDMQRQHFIAWAGMNASEGGWVMMFNFLYPEDEIEPTVSQKEVWENFLHKTHSLR